MAGLLSDVRHAIHLFLGQKVFAVTALVTIAVAIAANTIVLALVDGILLRPLRVARPDRVVAIQEVHHGSAMNVTGATFVDVTQQRHALASVAALRTAPASVSTGGAALQASASNVTTGYFDVLGAGSIRGRLFAREDAAPGSAAVVVNRAFWQRVLGVDPSVVGHTILVNAEPREIVGIADVPPSIPGSADLWLPFPDDYPLLQNRRAHLFTVIGRLRDGASVADAAGQLASIAAAASVEEASGSDVSLGVQPLVARMVEPIRPMLTVLWLAVSLLLVVASANVANLLMAQGARRTTELA